MRGISRPNCKVNNRMGIIPKAEMNEGFDYDQPYCWRKLVLISRIRRRSVLSIWPLGEHHSPLWLADIRLSKLDMIHRIAKCPRTLR